VHAVTLFMSELLPLYPELRVRQQNGLASLGGPAATWYFYRDGDGLLATATGSHQATTPDTVAS
jgi:hypothetical protein